MCLILLKANVYYCNCDQILDSSSIMDGELNEKIRVKLIPTQIMPIHFDRFSPVNLTEYEGIPINIIYITYAVNISFGGKRIRSYHLINQTPFGQYRVWYSLILQLTDLLINQVK